MPTLVKREIMKLSTDNLFSTSSFKSLINIKTLVMVAAFFSVSAHADDYFKACPTELNLENPTAAQSRYVASNDWVSNEQVDTSTAPASIVTNGTGVMASIINGEFQSCKYTLKNSKRETFKVDMVPPVTSWASPVLIGSYPNSPAWNTLDLRNGTIWSRCIIMPPADVTACQFTITNNTQSIQGVSNSPFGATK